MDEVYLGGIFVRRVRKELHVSFRTSYYAKKNNSTDVSYYDSLNDLFVLYDFI